MMLSSLKELYLLTIFLILINRNNFFSYINKNTIQHFFKIKQIFMLNYNINFILSTNLKNIFLWFLVMPYNIDNLIIK